LESIRAARKKDIKKLQLETERLKEEETSWTLNKGKISLIVVDGQVYHQLAGE
jgi:hypothetical protein